MTSDHVLVLTTIDSIEGAQRLARTAVEARVAACAQIEGPITSIYWWRDVVETQQEWRVQFKTAAARSSDLSRHIHTEHDYETPEIVQLDIPTGDQAYLAWVDAETAETSTTRQQRAGRPEN
jgi:periplasmic divalent cation tolerance protein